MLYGRFVLRAYKGLLVYFKTSLSLFHETEKNLIISSLLLIDK